MTNSPHRPCLALAAAFAAGIIVGKYIVLPMWYWLVVSAGFCGLYFANRSLVLVYLLCALLGALWVTQRGLLPRDSLAFLAYQEVKRINSIEGIVLSAEEGLVKVVSIDTGAKRSKVQGKVKLGAWGRRDLGLSYGAHVRMKGKMFAIHDMRQGSFSYRRYLQEKGVFWMFSPAKDGIEVLDLDGGHWLVSRAHNARSYINGIYAHYLEPREAAFVAALVIGARHNMPQDLKEVFVNTGTAHILAISGMNMAVVVSLFLFVFQLSLFSRQRKLILTVMSLLAYAYISGWSPSVVRAALMSAVLLLSLAFEYEGEALNSLGVAALMLMFLDPYVLFDAGFQLSFAAVAGILVLTNPIKGFLMFLPQYLGLPIAVSLAAFCATTPIMAYHFHIITPVSILANIPIVPLADLVMMLGLGLVCVSGVPVIATAFAAVLKAVLSTMILCALWFSQIPWGCWTF